MQPKTIRLFLGLFIILAIVAGFPLWKPYLPLASSKLTPIERELIPFSEVTTESFQIKHGEAEKRLTKSPSGWLVNDQAATVSAITDFFTNLKNLQIGEVVSKNPANLPNFGLTDNEGYQMRLTAEGKSAEFVVGSSGPDYGSFYFKQKDAVDVYLARGTLRDTLSLDLSAWQASPSVTATPKPDN